jgi:hypothetical protein
VLFLTASGAVQTASNVTFEDLLTMTGYTKKDLAADLGKAPESVSRWRDKPPAYVVAYLEVVAENDALKSRLPEEDDDAA